MKRSLVLIIAAVILQWSPAQGAGLIRLPSPDKDISLSVSQVEIFRNLTNYRDNSVIEITVLYSFLTKDASQRYKKNNPCPAVNNNDYKYILETWNFKFSNQGGYVMGSSIYDKYDNLLCGGAQLSTFDARKGAFAPVFKKLKELFDEADRRDKESPW